MLLQDFFISFIVSKIAMLTSSEQFMQLMGRFDRYRVHKKVFVHGRTYNLVAVDKKGD